MADVIYQYTFNNVPLTSANEGTETVNGFYQIDYTTSTSSGSLDVTTSQGDIIYDFPSHLIFPSIVFSNLSQPSPENYLLSLDLHQSSTTFDDFLSIQWTGQTPTTVDQITSSSNYRLIGPFSASNAPVTSAAVCFASGTRIRTLRGNIPVEDLRLTDLVISSSGERRPIKWIGHREVNCAVYREPERVWPIRIAAHAFAPNKPSRDVYLSPGHAICLNVLEEVLVPAAALINGATITQTPVDQVTYWHIELDRHDVLLANGLPAESYLEMGNRNFFADAPTVSLNATPDVRVRTHADFCRPFFADGPVVDAVRNRLAARAEALGWQRTQDMDLHLIVEGGRINPDIHEDVARFMLPASAGDIVLVSETWTPRHWGGQDGRCLGVSITGFHVSDGLTCSRDIPVDDPALADDFLPEEAADGAGWRWTNGRLRIPSSFWADCRSHVFLRVLFEPGQRWLPPVTASTISRSEVA